MRLAAVAATRLLDTAAEESFDRIAALARQVLDAPFAFLTVVDAQRSFWKAAQGIPADAARQNTLDESFCQYVVDSGEPLVLGDVRLDERTRSNPSIQSMGVVAWAGFPVHTPEGHVLGTLCVVDTVPRRWTAEQQSMLAALAEIASREVALRVTAHDAEAARARAALLARIGELLIAGLDLPAVWSALARLTVPALGDLALVYSLEHDGSLVPQAFEHRGPWQATALPLASEALQRRVEDAHGPGRVVGTGRTQVVSDIGALSRLSEAQRQLHALFDTTSSVAVPLRAGGALIGVLNVLRTTGSPGYTAADIELIEAIAARAALALDNALSYDQERSLSLHLQQALLPPLMPQPDHLQISTRYRPAGHGQVVGGDWYDAFLDRAGTTHLVIGDVAGHDIAAATMMGQLRTMVRAFSYAGTATPAGVLEAIDRCAAALGAPVFATTLVARIDRYDAAAPARYRELTWSTAGHLPALLLAVDGSVRLLDVRPDLPLGLGMETIEGRPARRDHAATLPPGATLLLYTDGLVERRGEDLQLGLQRLVDVVTELADLSLEDLCDAVLDRLQHGGDDDIALIAVRAFPEDQPRPAEAGRNYLTDRDAARS